MIRETGRVPTEDTGKRGQPPGSDHRSDDSTKGRYDKEAIDSQSRLCVGSTENEDGGLNGQVKPEEPGSQGVWDRDQGTVLATKKGHLLSLPSALCFRHQDLHPYSEMSVLTRSLFLRVTSSQDSVTCQVGW